MARIEWVKLRLDNWALWRERESRGGLGYGSSSAFLIERVDNDRYRESKVPVDDVEAGVTEQGVQALRAANAPLYETLHCWYVRGLGVNGTMRRLGRGRSSVFADLDRADLWLSVWFTERHARHEAARRTYMAATAALGVGA